MMILVPESFWTNERIQQRHDAIFTECRRDNLEPQAALSKCMELSYTIAQDSYEELHRLQATIVRLQAELAEAWQPVEDGSIVYDRNTFNTLCCDDKNISICSDSSMKSMTLPSNFAVCRKEVQP